MLTFFSFLACIALSEQMLEIKQSSIKTLRSNSLSRDLASDESNSVANGNRKETEISNVTNGQPVVDNFLSSTIIIQLSPVTEDMDEIQRDIFERALLAFYKTLFNGQETYEVDILAVSIIKHEFQNEEKDHILVVEAVVSGQFKPTYAPNLSSLEFGVILNEIGNRFPIHLQEFWATREKELLDKSDPYAEDTILFGLLENIYFVPRLENIGDGGGTDDTNRHSKTTNHSGIYIGVSIGFAAATLVLMYGMKKCRGNNNWKKFSDSKSLKTASTVDDYSFTDKHMKNMLIPYNKSLIIPRKINSYARIKTDEDGSGDDGNLLSKDNDRSKIQVKEDKITLQSECVAPPGKLGVAIDIINGHPVVHKIKTGSPLDGVLRRLDKIVAIDDIDTTSMTAAAVTQLMVKKMNKERKITFIRGHSGKDLLKHREKALLEVL